MGRFVRPKGLVLTPLLPSFWFARERIYSQPTRPSSNFSPQHGQRFSLPDQALPVAAIHRNGPAACS